MYSVYRITNHSNGMIYVGSCKTKNLNQRKSSALGQKSRNKGIAKDLPFTYCEAFNFEVVHTDIAYKSLASLLEWLLIEYHGCQAPCGYNETPDGQSRVSVNYDQSGEKNKMYRKKRPDLAENNRNRKGTPSKKRNKKAWSQVCKIIYLYQAQYMGMSEIAKMLDIPKTSVRSILVYHDIELRSKSEAKKIYWQTRKA